MKWTPRVSATHTYINARPCQSNLPFPVSRTHRHTSTLSLVRVISPFFPRRVSDAQTYINAQPCQSHLPFPASRPHRHQRAALSVISPFPGVKDTDMHQDAALSESSPLFMCLGHTRHTSMRGLVRVISPFFLCVSDTQNIRQRAALSESSLLFMCLGHTRHTSMRGLVSHLPFLCVSDTQNIRQRAALSESLPLSLRHFLCLDPFVLSLIHI